MLSNEGTYVTSTASTLSTQSIPKPASTSSPRRLPSSERSSARGLDTIRPRTSLDFSSRRESSRLGTTNSTEERHQLARFAVPSTYNSPHRLNSSPKARKDEYRRRPASAATLRVVSPSFRINTPFVTPHRPPQLVRPPIKSFLASSPRTSLLKEHHEPLRCSPSAHLSVTTRHGFLHEQNLVALMRATNYSRDELYARWARFKALCCMARNVSGVDKETLRHGIPQFSMEDQFFIDRAFEIFDTDGSGALDWPEFITALSVLEKSEPSRRVEFLFRAYDLNGDGVVQRQEVQSFFLASLLIPETPETLEVARHFVNKVFFSLGRDHEDSFRVQDVVNALRTQPASDAYSLFGRTILSTPLDASFVPPRSRKQVTRRKKQEDEKK